MIKTQLIFWLREILGKTYLISENYVEALLRRDGYYYKPLNFNMKFRIFVNFSSWAYLYFHKKTFKFT